MLGIFGAKPKTDFWEDGSGFSGRLFGLFRLLFLDCFFLKPLRIAVLFDTHL